MIKQYDKVKLNDGKIATVVEILSRDNEIIYVADVERSEGTNTEFISPQEIKEIIA